MSAVLSLTPDAPVCTTAADPCSRKEDLPC